MVAHDIDNIAITQSKPVAVASAMGINFNIAGCQRFNFIYPVALRGGTVEVFVKHENKRWHFVFLLSAFSEVWVDGAFDCEVYGADDLRI